MRQATIVNITDPPPPAPAPLLCTLQLVLREARQHFCRNGAQKLLGVLITIGEAVAYVVSGMYGDVSELGAVNATLIILQVKP